MKRSGYKKAAAWLLSCLLAVGSCFAGTGNPFVIVSYAEERPATVNASNLNVRSGPGTTYQSVGKLSYGTAVKVLSEKKASDGVLWYQIRFTGSGGKSASGYVSSQFIKFPTAIVHDGNFEQYMEQQGFPESYKPGLRELHTLHPQWRFKAFQTNLDWNTVIQNESIVGRNLVSRDSISSWKSTAPGAYDWNTGTWPGFDGNSWVQASDDIIRYYIDPRNFINDKYIFQFLNQSYDSSLHTRDGLAAMVAGTFLAGGSSGKSSNGGSSNGGGSNGAGTVNPGSPPGAGPGPAGPAEVGPGGSGAGSNTGNNAGNNTGNNAGNGTVPPISPAASISENPRILLTDYGPAFGPASGPGEDSGAGPGAGNGPGEADSNPSGTAPGSGSSSYIDIIMNAAVQSGVNPYILASMILQEQGSQGTSRSISGTVPGYEGYYNFFNIEAYQSGSTGAVERGLWWASQSGSYGRPWNSVEKSILGGSIYYGDNYVKKGQNTLYLKKFNVQGDNLYKHQYMTNVLAAAAEGLTLAKVDALKQAPLEFSIPVYLNMPDSPCVKPTLDGSPNNKLSGLGVDGFALTPTFNRDTEAYTLIVDSGVPSVKIEAAALDSTATVSGTGNVNLKSGNNEITVSVKAQNGSVRNYVIQVVRQSDGPIYSQSVGGISPGGSGPGPGSGPGVGPAEDSSGNNPGGGSVNPPGGGSVNPPGGGSGTVISPNGGHGSSSGGPGEGPSNGPSGPGGGSGQGSNIKMISANTQAAQLIQSMQPAYPGKTVEIYDSSGARVTGLVGTGCEIRIVSGGGSQTVSYQVVAKGDNNGDGKLDILDVLRVQRHILGLEALTGLYATASDVDGSGKIDVKDALLMQKDIQGIQKLN